MVIAVALSSYAAREKLATWRQAGVTYRGIEGWLTTRGVSDVVVMVGDPPAFWYHTRRMAVVVPNGNVRTLLMVCDRYDVEYVVLETNHPAGLEALYKGRVRHERLNPVATLGAGSVKIWEVE
jgi:hypothetical protein